MTAKDFTVPEFGVAPVDEMPTRKQVKYVSPAEKESQAAYDAFIQSLKKGEAGVANVPDGATFRTVMGRIRAAAKRCDVPLGNLRKDEDGRKVYVTVK